MKSCFFKLRELMFCQHMALLRKGDGEKKTIRAGVSGKSHPVSEGETAVFVMY